MMEYTVWRDLGEKLQTEDYAKYYFTPEKYTADNPLENLVVPPGITDFFGTKVYNFFMVAKPYGWKKEDGEWSDQWPPEGLQESIDRHIATFEFFTFYKTLIVIDFNFVNKLKERSPHSKIDEMISSTSTHLKDLCEGQLADYGFSWARVDDEVGPEYFAPYLNELYGISTE